MLSSPAECFTGHKDRAFSACLDFTATERRLVHSDESSGIHLPTRLRSTPITALHHYYAGSDSSQLLVRPRGIQLHVNLLPNIPSPTTTGSIVADFPSLFPPPDISSWFTPPFARELFRMNMGFTLRSQARHLHITESRLSPMDCSFLFCCSPPRLATTQLQSSTNPKD